MPDRPAPAAIFEVLRREQPTLFFGAPTLYAMMLADPTCTPENGSKRLGWCVSAAEALSRAASSVFGVLKRTAEASSREILLVDAQEEFVNPARVFAAEKI